MEIAARAYTFSEDEPNRIESVTDNQGDSWQVVGFGGNQHEYLVEHSSGRAAVFYFDRMSIVPLSEGAVYGRDHTVRDGRWAEHRPAL